MSETETPIPASLRDAVSRDLKPVRPLHAPWVRLLMLLPVVLLAFGMPLVYFRLRDTGELGIVFGWIPVAIQVFLAFALLLLALREGIPGFRGSASGVFALCLAAYGLQVLVNLAIFLRNPPVGAEASLSMWFHCFRMESLIGVPILVVVAWFVARTLPQRPVLAGFLAGSGAGFAGEASWRLICPVSDPAHVLLGHTGGVLILALTGAVLGYIWALFARHETAG